MYFNGDSMYTAYICVVICKCRSTAEYGFDQCTVCLLVTSAQQTVWISIHWPFLQEAGNPGSICMVYNYRPIWVLDRNHQILAVQHHLTQETRVSELS